MPYYNDDGHELNPGLMLKPRFCLACTYDDATDEMEQILCNLTRLDQQDEAEFVCLAFVSKTTGTSFGALEQRQTRQCNNGDIVVRYEGKRHHQDARSRWVGVV
jgi:hypothetical protein